MNEVTYYTGMPIVRAIGLLILAFLAAFVVRAIVNKALAATKFRDSVGKSEVGPDGRPTKYRSYVGQFAYLVTFLLFVPGIFDVLGVQDSALPLVGMLDTLLGYLPNILGAGVVLALGFTVARLVRDLAAPALQRLGVDRVQEHAGMKPSDDTRLSGALAYLAYAAVVIPVVVVALQVLGITAISDPAVAMLTRILEFVPNVVVALLMLAIGDFVARMASQLVQRLVATSSIDGHVAQATNNKMAQNPPSKIAGVTTRVVIDLLFAVEAAEIANLEALAAIGTTVLAYVPNILAALAIAIVAVLAARAVAAALKGTGMQGMTFATNAGIGCIAAFMVLAQLELAPAIVNTAFTALVASAAVAGAIAFGLGGRQAAKQALDRWTGDAQRLQEAADKTEVPASIEG